MKRTLINLAALALIAGMSEGIRARTHDVAFTYRMGAGFPGDVNRTHPASILPGLFNVANPVRLYGDPVLITGVGYRGFIAGDTTTPTTIAGIAVRPYPTQQTTGGMSASLGAAVPPAGGVGDVLNEGFIIARSNDFATNPPVKGGAVYVWFAASSGVHVQGGFETVATGGSTALISNARYNGPPDANGICEIQTWAA
jgi:hypothetical protein